MLLALRHPRLWLVSGWMLIVVAVIASLVPAHELPKLGGISDKIEHIVGYARAGAVVRRHLSADRATR